MSIPQLLEEINKLSQQNKDSEELNQTLKQAVAKIQEAEALLLVIDSTFGKLKQPLTVALGVSDLLLTEVDRNDPIVVDLKLLVKQVKRISEIVNGMNHVTRY